MKSFNAIVIKELHIPEEEITDTLTAKDVPDWDSMSYLIFIAELEKEFNIKFSMNEVLNADSIGAIKDIIRSKGVSL